MIKSWKNSDLSVREIITIAQETGISKIEVLKWFSNKRLEKPEIVNALLNSGWITIDDLKNQRNFTCGVKSRSYIYEFMKQSYKDITSAQEALDSSLLCAPSMGKDFFDKLVYFKSHNPKIYAEMLENSKPENRAELSYEIVQVENVEKHRDIIIELLVRHKGLYRSVINFESISNAQIEDVIELIELKKRKQSDYKDLKVAQLIMYKATPENKWEILEYFAENNEQVFKKIMQEYCRKEPKPYVESYTIKEFLDRYQNIDTQKLPKPIVEYVALLQERNKPKERSTTNKSTKVQKSFSFKIGQINVATKEDLIKVVDLYLKANMSIQGFCGRYLIDDPVAFRQALNILSEDDAYYAEKISEVLETQRENYLATIKNNINALYNGTISVADLVYDASGITLERYCEFAKKYYDGAYDVFCLKVIEYYNQRLNAYSDETQETASKALTSKEVRFIAGPDEYKAMVMGKKGSLEMKLNKSLSVDKDNIGKFSELKRGIVAYNTRFLKSNYFKEETKIVDDNGSYVLITPEIVQNATNFAFSRKIYACNKVMNNFIRLMAKNKLEIVDNEDRILQAKRRQAKKLLYEITELDEFLMQINDYNQK